MTLVERLDETNRDEIARLRNIIAIQQKQIERLMDARDAEQLRVKNLQELLNQYSPGGGRQ